MEGNKMVIWQDINVVIEEKQVHVRRIGGRAYRSFIRTCGDVPVVRFNAITGKAEDVVNNRGRAYAARRRRSYRRKAA
jgi:hypothetical protein